MSALAVSVAFPNINGSANGNTTNFVSLLVAELFLNIFANKPWKQEILFKEESQKSITRIEKNFATYNVKITDVKFVSTLGKLLADTQYL